ncbi:MAG: UDP-N-acetylmuramate--L-alanine ligase [Chloroflexi bacterium]|jgi:UDP-N-acetylmuramate--alanine ligase|nr:UDP-N-acetylmuramate--L-alanine ligase [Chloroflexota bacterium]
MDSEMVQTLPRHIHLVGIGGIGLSAIARVLAAWGYQVSGSDQRASAITQELNQQGIVTYVGHAGTQVADAELVVISSAVPETNAEVQAARAAGIPVIKRQQLLGLMMADSVGVAVAGTHGKTTTTAMLSVMLTRLNLSPTFIVGGIVSELGTNAQAGKGPHFVIEADEYDRMFHGLRPRIAVVTNLEMDHPDCYPTMADYRQAFATFLERVPADGQIVACVDGSELAALLRERDHRGPRALTYGISPEAEYQVRDVAANARGGVDFCVVREGQLWGSFTLSVPGRHNALNATAALLVAECLGIDRASAGQALAEYRGVLRRFEVKGERQGVVVVDDYAHHPTEIRATLAAARARYPGRRLWAVWQPHTYSRTEALLNEFRSCFADADQVIITDIYAARAREQATIHGEALAVAIDHAHVRYLGSLERVVETLGNELCSGDVLITLGAGDGYLIGERILVKLGKGQDDESGRVA